MTLPRPHRGAARRVPARRNPFSPTIARSALSALFVLSAAATSAIASPPGSKTPRAASPAPRAAAVPATPGHALRLDLDGPAQSREAAALRRRGFRPLSMDAFGDAENPRFASSWVREQGADWFLARGVSASALADSLAAWGARGWQPSLITGTGEAPAFAVVLERDSVERKARVALDRDAFRLVSDSAQRAGYRPAWVDAYGTPDRPLFAGIWRRNTDGVPWNYSLGDDEASLREKAATFAPVWVRPSLVVPTPDGRLFTLWEEGSVGAWSLLAPMSREEAAAQAAKGRHPLHVSGPARDGAGFTALYAASARPLPKAFTATGPESPGLEAFDAYVERLMRAHQVRAGSLAMVKDGRLVMARGYTYAEPGYPVTRPNSLFRVASCSKPLTSIAVHRLLKEGGAGGTLDLKEKVLSLLGSGDSAAPADGRFADITIDDLLSHSAGWVRSPDNPDPVFNDYPSGHAIRKRLPAMAKDFLAYMLGQPLQFAPGSRSAYANFGYFLLGRILETMPHGAGHAAGAGHSTYEQAMADLVFRPLGLTRPRFGSSRLEERDPGEVLYHARSPYLQRGREPGGPAWVAGAYGDFELRNMDAAGAWILSAPDYAKVLAAFDQGDANPVLPPEAVRTMWAPPHNPRYLRGWFATRLRKQADGDTLVAKWHNGLFPGTSTLVFYRPDKWSFALFLNRDLSPQLSGDKEGREMAKLADQVESWPERDLFPEMGIRSFMAAADSGGPGGRPGRDHYITANH